jgi:hypothetical protein
MEHVVQSINPGDTYFITVAFCLEHASINFGLLVLGNPTWLFLILSYVTWWNILVVTVNQVCIQGWFILASVYKAIVPKLLYVLAVVYHWLYYYKKK